MSANDFDVLPDTQSVSKHYTQSPNRTYEYVIPDVLTPSQEHLLLHRATILMDYVSQL